MKRFSRRSLKSSADGRSVMRRALLALLLAGGWSLELAAAERAPTPESDTDWAEQIERLRGQGENPSTLQQLAASYNNYGVSLANQGQLPEAVQQLEEALRLEPANASFQSNLSAIHVKLAQAAYEAHNLTAAKEEITHALLLNPKDSVAYATLGSIEYQRQHLKEAKAAWEQTLSLDPSLQDIHEKLAQLNRELPVESSFEKLSQLYFDLRYTSELERSTGFDLRDALLDARRKVGSDFACWPKSKLVVLIYNSAQFRDLRQSTPEWVGGQYDGKIRVPLPGKEFDEATVRRILFHEYTHAVVYELVERRCPLWFNEGLAEYEGWKEHPSSWSLLRRALSEPHSLSWAALAGSSWSTLSAHDASLAYQQAHSIVCYLAERYGVWRIRRVLKALANETPLETAFSQEFHVKPARLEENWRQWLVEFFAQHAAESPAPTTIRRTSAGRRFAPRPPANE